MKFSEFIVMNKQGVLIAAVVLLLGFAAYYSVYGLKDSAMGKANGDMSIYDGIELKVGYTPDGAMKLFALAKNNEIAKYKATEGANLPEADSIVLGATEGAMMKEEKLISGQGSELKGFFGINTSIGGILAKTGTQADMFHFLSSSQFDAIDGEKGKMFIRLDDENSPDLIYYLPLDGKIPPKFEFAEGNLSDYKTHELGGETFYPMILGADEARMMRRGNEFARIGDTMRGELGKNIVVVGVLKPANSAMDMAHFVPLSENELP